MIPVSNFRWRCNTHSCVYTQIYSCQIHTAVCVCTQVYCDLCVHIQSCTRMPPESKFRTDYRIYPQMFAKTISVLKCVWILYLHKQEMGHNGSRGRPQSVAPEFLSWRRTEVKISPPKVAEISSFPIPHFMRCSFGWNEATFVNVRPDWLEFDGSEDAESIQDVLVSHR